MRCIRKKVYGHKLCFIVIVVLILLLVNAYFVKESYWLESVKNFEGVSDFISSLNVEENSFETVINKSGNDNDIFQLTDNDKNSLVYALMGDHDSICFVGDSITEGSANDYHPWYEELIGLFDNKDIFNFSKSGYRTDNIISEYREKLKDNECSLVIINIGTNDIRSKKRSSEEYLENMEVILNFLEGKDVILLSPWRTTDVDIALKEDKEVKIKLYDEYDEGLENMAAERKGVFYVEVNNYIKRMFNRYGEELYVLDGVHPNNELGIKLYSYSVLRS